MKMKWGALVVDGRNKIGGHVASKNRGGSYLRTKVTPVNPNTIDQITARGRIASLSQAWKSLTQTERDSWNNSVQAWARTDIFGDLRNPSGFNLYMRLNSNLLEVGIAAINTAPIPSSVYAPSLTLLDCDVSSSTFDVGFAPAPVPTDTTVIVRATGALSPGVKFVKNQLRNIALVSSAGVSPQDLFTSYIAKFGGLVAGSQVVVEVVAVNEVTGQKGATSQISAIVTA
jgi:hypothetical protein